MHIHKDCGKCGSGKLLEVPATPSDHSHIVFGERVLRTVAVGKYVCTDCGYVEHWVNSKSDLGELRDAWSRQQRPVSL